MKLSALCCLILALQIRQITLNGDLIAILTQTDNNSTNIKSSSSPAVKTTVWDFGKNKENIRTIEDFLTKGRGNQ